MNPSKECYDIIKLSEQCVLHAYPDPASPLAGALIKAGLWYKFLAGKVDIPGDMLKKHSGEPWTIGWGHTGDDVYPGLLWTQEKADNTLVSDVNRTAIPLNGVMSNKPLQHQFDAMVSFAYNVGTGAFKDSTLLRKFNAWDVEGAANEFKRWNKAGGKVLQGLIVRRKREENLFRGKPWRP